MITLSRAGESRRDSHLAADRSLSGWVQMTSAKPSLTQEHIDKITEAIVQLLPQWHRRVLVAACAQRAIAGFLARFPESAARGTLEAASELMWTGLDRDLINTALMERQVMQLVPSDDEPLYRRRTEEESHLSPVRYPIAYGLHSLSVQDAKQDATEGAESEVNLADA